MLLAKDGYFSLAGMLVVVEIGTVSTLMSSPAPE
jgi:hypothetical protein